MTSATKVFPLRTGQAGFGLVEVLVSVVILGVVAAGVATAMFTSLSTSVSVRTASRLNSLTTSFAESVKSLPYQQCAEPDQYQLAFESMDSQSEVARRLLGTANSTFEVVEVVDDQDGSASCPDSGTQRVTLRVDFHDRTQTVTLVKRNPEPTAPPTVADFRWEFYVGAPGSNSDTTGFRLIPDIEAPTGVVQLEWWCDAEWMSTPGSSEPAAPGIAPDYVYRSDNPTDEILCGEYAAPIAGSTPAPATHQRTAALRVTDGSGRQTVRTHVIEFPTTTRGALPPLAFIQLLSTPLCVPGALCPHYSEVRFDAFGSSAAEGRRLEYCSWNFGDGSPEVVQYGPTCPTEQVTHRFAASGLVTLTVTDDLGNVATAYREIAVEGPDDVLPTVQFVAAIGEESRYGDFSTAVHGIAPSRVRFHASATPGNADGTITNFEIIYADGTPDTSSGPGNPDTDPRTRVFEPAYAERDGRLYPHASTAGNCSGRARGFPATVRVTESLPVNLVRGRTSAVNLVNSAQVCVTIDAFVPPAAIRTGNTEQSPPFAQHNGVMNYRNVWVWPIWDPGARYTELRFAIDRPSMPTWVRQEDVRMVLRIRNVFGAQCVLHNYETTFQDLLVPAGQESLRQIRFDGTTFLFSSQVSRCGFEVKVQRRFEGAWLETAYSNLAGLKEPV